MRRSEIRLKHCDSLLHLLNRLVCIDPFAAVRPRYTVPLDARMHAELAAAMESLDTAVLVPVLRDFMASQLTEEHISAKQSIKSVAGYLSHNDCCLMDLPWFSQFPGDIPMANFLHVVKWIDEAQ